MKTAEYCVDYLSYQWTSTDDLITTYKEICKQRQKYVVNHISTTTSLLQKNQKKLKKSEEYKLKRFQNALWRTMAKNCTNHLGKSNKLINPATVSWQKESDITWLYGPVYYNVETTSSNHGNKNRLFDSQPRSSLLKPVLKKQTNTFLQPYQQQQQMLSTCSDSNSLLLFYSSVVTTSEEMHYQQQHHSYHSGGSSITTSASSSTRSSFSSVSSSSSTSSKIGVHFNPEIIEIEYQPEYPVSLESSPLSCPTLSFDGDEDITGDYGFYHSEEEQEEEAEEDDAIWSLLVDASKSFTYTQISYLFSKCKTLYQRQQQQKSAAYSHTTKNYSPIPPARKNDQHTNSSSKYHSIQLFYLMISMMKLTTTWLLYQSLSPLSLWLSLTASTATAAKPSSSSSSSDVIAVDLKSTAGQSTTTTTSKQSKKAVAARLIIL